MAGCRAALFVDGVEAAAAAAPPQAARCPLRLPLPRRLRAHGALHCGQLPHERLAALHGLVLQVGQRLALPAAALGRLAVVEVSVGLVGGRRRLLLERAPVACSLTLVKRWKGKIDATPEPPESIFGNCKLHSLSFN